MASAAATGAQVLAHLRRTQARTRAAQDDRTRQALATELRADRHAARAAWVPALDPHWLAQADLSQTARTWQTAMPYANPDQPWHEPSALTAMHHCEARLRVLHPYGMQRYDHLITQGRTPADAMSEAAPFFSHSPGQVAKSRTTAKPAVAARPGRPPSPRSRRPWTEDFPWDIRDVLTSTATTTRGNPSARPLSPAPGTNPSRPAKPQP
jgi:hypothetical protein